MIGNVEAKLKSQNCEHVTIPQERERLCCRECPKKGTISGYASAEGSYIQTARRCYRLSCICGFFRKMHALGSNISWISLCFFNVEFLLRKLYQKASLREYCQIFYSDQVWSPSMIPFWERISREHILIFSLPFIWFSWSLTVMVSLGQCLMQKFRWWPH